MSLEVDLTRRLPTLRTFGGYLLHHLGRNTGYDCVRWHIVSHNSTRADDCSTPHMNPIRDDGPGADPHVILDQDSLGGNTLLDERS